MTVETPSNSHPAASEASHAKGPSAETWLSARVRDSGDNAVRLLASL